MILGGIKNENIVRGEIFGLGFILIQINYDNENLFIISLPNIKFVICPNGSLIKNSLGSFVPLNKTIKHPFEPIINAIFKYGYFKSFNLNIDPSECVILLESTDTQSLIERIYTTHLRKLKLELIDEN